MASYFDKLEPEMDKEEEALSRALLELRHLLESGRINAKETRKRCLYLGATELPPDLRLLDD